MKILNNELHIHDVFLYGCDGDDMFTDYEDLAGCPYLYKLKTEGKEPQLTSYELAYGRMYHKMMWAVAKEDLTPEEALKKYYDPFVGTKGFDEAWIDIERMMRRQERNTIVLDAEIELRLPLFEYKGEIIWYVGTLDTVEYDPDDDRMIFYRDYKTNRSPMSQDDIDRNLQFTGYSVLVEENLEKLCKNIGYDPETVNVIGILDMIKFYSLYTSRSESQKERFKAWIESMARKILDDKKGRRVLNSSCGYCHVRFDCPEFDKIVHTGERYLIEMKEAEKLADRVKIMHKLQDIRLVMDKVIKSVQEELKKHPGVYDGMKYELVQKTKNTVDLPKLHSVTGMDFYSLVTATMQRLKNYVIDHPEMEDVVMSLVSEVFDGYTLKKTRV